MCIRDRQKREVIDQKNNTSQLTKQQTGSQPKQIKLNTKKQESQPQQQQVDTKQKSESQGGSKNFANTQQTKKTGTDKKQQGAVSMDNSCLLYTSPSPRDRQKSRMPSSA
eukprot:TRINITY_DN16360_c0_g1_i1.p3 TRINITY_DN16360_c0_g1~~TRINITY_DN16360_c0_g1_i1.p3  ORF type:complete len:110 (+),score=32.14 TRINITY_DN16360_c0_g1_i1:62-391(+)